jgi:hypothetical protein
MNGIDYPYKISNNSYNNMGFNAQEYNFFNRSRSYNRQQTAVNFFGINTLRDIYADDHDNLAYKLPRRFLMDPKLILQTPLVKKQYH